MSCRKTFTSGAVALAVLMSPLGLQAQDGAIISNGTVQLGVNATGNLNFQPPEGEGVGLRDVASGFESTFPGCPCEGWGAGVVGGTFDGVSGFANEAEGGPTNLTNVIFTSTANSARSEVTVVSGSTNVMTVVHDYHPSSATPNLYEVTVTITNVSGETLGSGDQGLRYRRYMDWDIPSPGDEVVSLRGVGATNLIRSGNAGPGNTANPLEPFDCTVCDANFTNETGDIGAAFDFAFPALAAGESRTFTTFYGSAPNIDAMRAALGAVGAEVFSLAFCGEGNEPECGPNGTPATFAFGFQGVGGTPVEPPPDGGPPPMTPIPEPGTMVLMATGLAGLLGRMRRRQHA